MTEAHRTFHYEECFVKMAVPTQLRSIEIVLGTFHRPDGSGSFGFGDTKTLASVLGPMQARLAVELPSKACFEVTVRPLMGIAGWC